LNEPLCQINRVAILPANEFFELDTAAVFRDLAQATVDKLCAERDKLVGEQRIKYPATNKVIKGPQMRR
jgi:hypothetical protein